MPRNKPKRRSAARRSAARPRKPRRRTARPRKPRRRTTRSARRAAPRRTWARRSAAKLLDLRFCDLGLRLKGSWVEDCLETLSDELARRGLRFRPHAWLSVDWFTPDGVPGIAVPFYLVHPKLMRLERSQMLEVEGGTRQECLKILRHECGHAIQHAYRLERRAEWRRRFGSPARRYPDVYRPNPASRRYVQHLRLYYAQSHPVEDFAETFAVWLQPRGAWRRRYAGWPALQKLEYVDRLMGQIGDAVPPVRTRRRVEPLTKVRTTLREHYRIKREQYSLSYPDLYDRDLRRLFSDLPKHRRFERASHFLRRNRADIRQRVARWTGEHQFTLDQVLNDMIGRCRELKLRAVGAERKLRMDFALLLAVRTMHFLYSRRNWIAL